MTVYDHCLNCDEPMRDHTQRASDHPGTRQKATKTQCYRCYVGSAKELSVQLTPEDLQDQRHILMSDAEMWEIWYRDPDHWEWLMQRRYRLDLIQEAAA